MSRFNIQLAAEVLSLTAFLSLLGTAVAFAREEILNWATLTLSVALPISMSATLWLWLALSNRERDSQGNGVKERLGPQSKPLLRSDGSSEEAVNRPRVEMHYRKGCSREPRIGLYICRIQR